MSLTVTGCATSRVAYTENEQAAASLPNFPSARFWSDDHAAMDSMVKLGLEQRVPGPFSMLALSGGGANGAYGAGFLTGWTETGTRPEFSIVTGVSVGALIAPFAFIGPKRDDELTAMFTSGEAQDIMEFAGLNVLFGGSGVFSEVPLRKLVEAHVDKDLLEDVAVEYNEGRLLLVATTDVDSQRTAIWNMGAIAESATPDAIELFQTILLASASVPGVFAPKPIRVEANGKVFTEMHVDGGVTSNLILVPEALLATESPVPLGRNPQFFAIINGKLDPEFQVTRPGIVNIVERSFETTLKANTQNQLLASRDYVNKHKGQLHVTAIDASYPLGNLLDFSVKQTAPLFELGAAEGRKTNRWLANPF